MVFYPHWSRSFFEAPCPGAPPVSFRTCHAPSAPSKSASACVQQAALAQARMAAERWISSNWIRSPGVFWGRPLVYKKPWKMVMIPSGNGIYSDLMGFYSDSMGY